uniref:Small subunit processome component 20 homolog n=1 Tax=Rhizophora mucronata TaxID=61149 RepID=A0A2P2MES7_RHIMU
MIVLPDTCIYWFCLNNLI